MNSDQTAAENELKSSDGIMTLDNFKKVTNGDYFILFGREGCKYTNEATTGWRDAYKLFKADANLSKKAIMKKVYCNTAEEQSNF